MTRRAWRFFHENAGGVVGEAAVTAAALARAEERAREEGLTFSWIPDDDADLSWMSERERAQDHEVLICVAFGPEGRSMACLGGIVDPCNAYRRVVEAELALEALPE